MTFDPKSPDYETLKLHDDFRNYFLLGIEIMIVSITALFISIDLIWMGFGIAVFSFVGSFNIYN